MLIMGTNNHPIVFNKGNPRLVNSKEKIIKSKLYKNLPHRSPSSNGIIGHRRLSESENPKLIFWDY